MNNKIKLIIFLILIISLYIIVGIPYCQKHNENIIIEKEIKSLTIKDVDRIVINFNHKYNDGKELVIEGDDKILLLNIIINSEYFNPNHPDVNYIGSLSLFLQNDIVYEFDIYNYEKMNTAYLGRKFGSYGNYKSYELYEWLKYNVNM